MGVESPPAVEISFHTPDIRWTATSKSTWEGSAAIPKLREVRGRADLVCCCGDDDAITYDEAEATESDARVGRAHAAARVCGEHVERKQGEIQVAQE